MLILFYTHTHAEEKRERKLGKFLSLLVGKKVKGKKVFSGLEIWSLNVRVAFCYSRYILGFIRQRVAEAYRDRVLGRTNREKKRNSLVLSAYCSDFFHLLLDISWRVLRDGEVRCRAASTPDSGRPGLFGFLSHGTVAAATTCNRWRSWARQLENF